MTIDYRRIDFSDVYLYAVTPPVKDAQKLLEKADQLLAGGIDALQLRCRELSDRALVELGKKLKEKCHKADALFLINNRPDICLAVDADGIHIGHEDLPIPFVRELVGHRRIVGVSTHSLPEALDAQRQGADYVSCGPLWATPTKPEYKPVGVNLINFYNAALKVPFVAIGSIDKNNIDEVIEIGARRIALVRGLFDADDGEAAAKFFKNKLLSSRPKAHV